MQQNVCERDPSGLGSSQQQEARSLVLGDREHEPAHRMHTDTGSQ
jgi:hypothetical protein